VEDLGDDLTKGISPSLFTSFLLCGDEWRYGFAS
jgi:hypothetical protein